MPRLFFLLLISFNLFTHAEGLPASIKLAAAHWCPYSCDPERTDGRYGIIADYVSALLKNQQVKLAVDVLPWSRAIKLAEAGHYDGLLTAASEEAKNLLITNIPTTHYRNCFFGQHQSNYWRYNNQDSLSSVTLAYVKDYGYEEPIYSYIQKPDNTDKLIQVTGAKPLERLIKLVDSDRADVFIEEQFVAKWQIQKVARTLNEPIGPLSCLPAYPFFMAFHPKSSYSPDLIDFFNDAMAKPENKLLLRKITQQYLRH